MSSRKPVLIVALLFRSRGAIGGMAQRFALLATRLIEDGHPVELLTTRSLLEHLRISPNRNMRVVDDTHGKIPLSGWWKLTTLIARVAAGRYAHLHVAGGGRLTIPLLYAAGLSGTPKSTTFASRTLQMAAYGREREIRKWKRILDMSDRVDVLNPGHELATWQHKVSVSPGSFPSRYREMPASIGSDREALAVFCGALEKTKNPILAIDAFALHLKDGGEGRLVLFGRGGLSALVDERIRSVNGSVGYEAISLGNPCDYFATLNKASAFLSLQDFDNYPSQSLIEAMMMGCRCIATADGDTRLMFPEGGENLVIDSREPAEFALAVRKLLTARSASFQNRDHASRKHGIIQFSEYFLEFLNINRHA